MLYKAELWSNVSCQRAVTRAFVNGKAVSPIWDASHGVWKVGNIGISAAATVAGTAVGSIGFELAALGPCPTLKSFCHGGDFCAYSLFDDAIKCCPGGVIGSLSGWM